MKTIFKYLPLLLVTVVSQNMVLRAQNPIVQTYFTADPAPMEHNGKLYLYTTHDEDETVNNFFTMYDWRCYSSEDMVNWTDHGAVASLESFQWSEKTNGAWAPQCIERNGKFYLYCPIHGDGIGVLVADSPTGPFTDPLGKRLIDSDNIWHDIDPTVFVDDDGQAYLFWGNPQLYYVKLNKDMISYDQKIGKNGIVAVKMDSASFGSKKRRDGKMGTTYTEGPWIYKRNKLYYMVYAAAGIPEYIAYSTATSVEGPWTYRGYIMERAPHLAFTNHPGIIDYKGNSYFFYHSQDLPGGEGFRRSVCVEQFTYNKDGSIPLIQPSKQGIKQGVSKLDPYKRVEAETIAWSKGIKSIKADNEEVYVVAKQNNAFIKVKGVDFQENGPSTFTARLGTTQQKGSIMEIRLDSPDGKQIASIDFPVATSGKKWDTKTVNVKKITGAHDVFFIFKGKAVGNLYFDYWSFSE